MPFSRLLADASTFESALSSLEKKYQAKMRARYTLINQECVVVKVSDAREIVESALVARLL